MLTPKVPFRYYDQSCECRVGSNNLFAGRESAKRSYTGQVEPHTSSGGPTNRCAQDPNLQNTNIRGLYTQETYTKHSDIQDGYIEAAEPQDEYAKDTDYFMKAMDQAIAKTVVLLLDCPCHAPTLQLRIPIKESNGEHDPLSRFLAEGSLEQSTCFFRTDTGTLSISRKCICGRLVEQVAPAGQSNDS